jgi:hypothetical protein
MKLHWDDPATVRQGLGALCNISNFRPNHAPLLPEADFVLSAARRHPGEEIVVDAVAAILHNLAMEPSNRRRLTDALPVMLPLLERLDTSDTVIAGGIRCDAGNRGEQGWAGCVQCLRSLIELHLHLRLHDHAVTCACACTHTHQVSPCTHEC